MRYQTRVSLAPSRHTPATPNFASPTPNDVTSAKSWQDKLKLRNKVRKKWNLALPLEEREASIEYLPDESATPIVEEESPVVLELKKKGLRRKLKKKASKFNKSLRRSMTSTESSRNLKTDDSDVQENNKASVEFVPDEDDIAKSVYQSPTPAEDSKRSGWQRRKRFSGINGYEFSSWLKEHSESLRRISSARNSVSNKSFRKSKKDLQQDDDDEIARSAYQSRSSFVMENDESSELESPKPSPPPDSPGLVRGSSKRSGWQRRKRFSKVNGYDFASWLKETGESLRSLGPTRQDSSRRNLGVSQDSVREISVQHDDDDIARSAYQSRASFEILSDDDDKDKPSPPPPEVMASPGAGGASKSGFKQRKRFSKMNGYDFTTWLKESSESFRSLSSTRQDSSRRNLRDDSVQNVPDNDDDDIARSAYQSRASFEILSDGDEDKPSPPPPEVMASPGAGGASKSGFKQRKRFSKMNGYDFSAWLKESSESFRSLNSRSSVRQSKTSSLEQHPTKDEDDTTQRSSYQSSRTYNYDTDEEDNPIPASPKPEVMASPGAGGASRSGFQERKRFSKMNGYDFSSWLEAEDEEVTC